MERGAGHCAVLRADVVELLNPAGRKVFLDCTVGLGGHAEALLDAGGSEARLIGMDVDEGTLRLAGDRLRRFGDRVRLFHANFAEAELVLAEAGVAGGDALLADLGVASNQLDDPARGLSFTRDGPLDMRLDPTGPRTAADLVNKLPERELADLIYANGEERFSRRIARAIVAARKRKPLAGTRELADVICRAIPAAARKTRRGVHPATRTFQSLRIAVNMEMQNLDRLLDALPRILSAGAAAAIISFHSLEDRRVKQAFARLARTGSWSVLTKKPIVASAREKAENPRSRSAKLRGIERLT